ncbi:BnaA08g11760D [Brassica napus]|uniref:BnaA08g11760D protein n=1 Tax=Brassica napus TaxID=3708 RepID=A0A078IPV8_BRANA|nr:BnaA08g11760D [Brassica napus]
MVLTAVDSASAATPRKLDSLSTVKEDPWLFEQEESFAVLSFTLIL